jgi:hypothetical protein
MKLVLFDAARGDGRPGVLTADGVVDVAAVVPRGHAPQLTMQGITDGFDSRLERLVAEGARRARRPLTQYLPEKCRRGDRSGQHDRAAGAHRAVGSSCTAPLGRRIPIALTEAAYWERPLLQGPTTGMLSNWLFKVIPYYRAYSVSTRLLHAHLDF